MTRSVLRQLRYVAAAAAEECGRVGHPAVDVDHLLMGLLCSGGPSARALTGAGVTLPAVREAVGALQLQDLAALGITAATPAPARQHDYGAAARDVGWTPRALAVVRGLDVRRDDRALLEALLDEPGGAARRLLQAAGADESALRAALPVAAAVGTAPQQRTPVPAGTAEASLTTLLPVPREAVWALLADPSRRAEWDSWYERADVSDDGAATTTSRRRRGRVATSTHVVSRWQPLESIAWSERRDDPRTGLRHLRVDLEPAGAGCEVTLTRRYAPQRRLGRAMVLLARPFMRSELRFKAQSIAQAVSGP